jgi:predicted ATPase
MVTELHVAGYRSVRDMRLPLSSLNVLVGANGCGKSNLHRAMYLIHSAATGRFARALADEGGMPSVLWAGPRKRGPVRLLFGVSFSEGVTYQMECGLPEPNEMVSPLFSLDPLFKEETIVFRDGRNTVNLLERGKSNVELRDDSGKRATLRMVLTRNESILTQVADPYRYGHLAALKERLSGWRFYHQFRTDIAAPLRQPQVGVYTPVLSHDGEDLAAALATIQAIGDSEGLDNSIREGSKAELAIGGTNGRFQLQLLTRGLSRPMEAWEMSDGTLRYLCLLAALMSPRPPRLLALNEPEASLHPDLLPPLAERIVAASRHSQIWLATHSTVLAEAIERSSGVAALRLEKINGETRIAL